MPTKSFLSGLILAFCAVASLCSVAAERRAPAQSNSASTTLIETASRQYENGQLDQAAATLERALHIQPNNPATLHYLGVLRLQQGQYQQAETLAARSNMRVGGNVALRNRNFQLIQAAQQAQASGIPPNAKEDLVAAQKGCKRRPKGAAKRNWPLPSNPLPTLGTMLATSLAQRQIGFRLRRWLAEPGPKENYKWLMSSRGGRTLRLRSRATICRLRANAESGFLIVRRGISLHPANARSCDIGFRQEPIWCAAEF